jgi:hypothetical protein
MAVIRKIYRKGGASASPTRSAVIPQPASTLNTPLKKSPIDAKPGKKDEI